MCAVIGMLPCLWAIEQKKVRIVLHADFDTTVHDVFWLGNVVATRKWQKHDVNAYAH